MPDPLDQLIADAQPVRDADLDGRAGQELHDLSLRFLRGSHRKESGDRPKRRPRIWVGVGATVLLTGLAGPAAALWVALHTGVDDSMTHSEEWRMDSPEAPAALKAFTKDYPLAPGYRTEPMIDQFRQKNAQMPETAVRQYVWQWSRCTWEQTWLDARANNDQKAETAAASALASFPDRSHKPVALYDYGTTNYDDAEQLAQAVSDDPALVAQDVEVSCEPVVVK